MYKRVKSLFSLCDFLFLSLMRNYNTQAFLLTYIYVLGAVKPSPVETSCELFVMRYTPCLNYQASSRRVIYAGWLCSFVPAHAAINIDYRDIALRLSGH